MNYQHLEFALWFTITIFLFSSENGEASFRFFKSLWSSTSSPSPQLSAIAIESSTMSNPIPLPSGNMDSVSYTLIRQPNSSSNGNDNNINRTEFERFNISNGTMMNWNQIHKQPLEELENEDSNELNVTLPPAIHESNENVSTYFGENDNNKPLMEVDETESEKPFEVLIQNDRTMAHLKFDESGKDLVLCQLFDLEKEESAVTSVPMKTGLRPPLTADYKTMLEAVRRCTDLARKQLHQSGSLPSKVISLNETLTNTSSFNSSTMNETDNVPIGGLPPTPTTINTNTSNANGVRNTLWDNSSFISLWKGIIPGTKWCGLGDSAIDYNDLGTRPDIDLCCRAHDHCPIRLKAFRVGYGLMNLSFYTK